MRMRVLTTKLRVEIENETRVFLESQFRDQDESLAEVCRRYVLINRHASRHLISHGPIRRHT